MNPPDDSTDPCVKAALEQLHATSPRDAEAAARGRAAFLAQAEMVGQAVSVRSLRRHRGQIHFFFGKEMSPMTTLATIVLVLALALGGTGGAVYAAQDDLPTGMLYSLKLLSEDARLSVTADPAARAGLLLEFVQRRVQEMTALSAESQPPLEPVATRLREEVDAALQLAAGGDDATRNQVLTQIKTQLENGQEAMTQAQASASGAATPILEQTRAMLQERQQLIQTGLTDPQAFRDQVQDQTRDQDRLQTGTPQTGPDPSRTPEPTGTALGPRPTHPAEPTGTAQRGPDPSRTPEPTGTALGPRPTHPAEPTGTAQRGPDPSRTPEPIGTALGPGPMNSPVGPGPQNTPPGPGPMPTSADPGPMPTSADPGPMPTSAGPGPMPTSAGPGGPGVPGGPKKP